MNRARPGSIGLRVCVFFAANPDEALSVDDIAQKTGHSAAAVQRSMRGARDNGLVSVESVDCGTSNLYTAGPALLAMLGRKA